MLAEADPKSKPVFYSDLGIRLNPRRGDCNLTYTADLAREVGSGLTQSILRSTCSRAI
jgi:hypothetical protein